MSKWNRKTLLAACEALIEREDFQLRLGTIDPKVSTAHVEYTWGDERGAHDISVVLDSTQTGLIEGLLHECLHVVLADSIADNFNRKLEEVCVRHLEQELWNKTMKSADVIRWRTIINQKLEEAS